MKKKREQFNLATFLKDRRLPIVILDEHWHNLFVNGKKPYNVQDLEKKLGDLMKHQGKMVTDVKSLKVAKHKLMQGIVANMNVDNSEQGQLNDKKLKESQRLINDINGKLANTDNNLADIPYQIKEANVELVAESMDYVYQKMTVNTSEIQDLELRINTMKEELKRMILRKQDMEDENSRIYTYMHDVLGSDVMEAMDQYYNNRR